MISVAIKKLREDAIEPLYATAKAAGADVAIPSGDVVTLRAGRVTKVPLGIAMSIPTGFEGQVRSRSDLSSRGISVAGGVCTIDADYRGEISILLYNSNKYDTELVGGTRIAQIVFNKVETTNFCTWQAQDGDVW